MMKAQKRGLKEAKAGLYDCTTATIKTIEEITGGGGKSFAGGSEMKRENEIM